LLPDNEDYLPTLGIKIVRQWNFTGATDTTRNIIVNEEMVKEFGWDEPIGRRLNFRAILQIFTSK
jgi:hypothetical protein